MQGFHYNDVMMSVMTGVRIVYSTPCSGVNQRKPQSSASLTCVKGIHQWLGNSPREGPVTRKMFPFDDVVILVSSLMLFWTSCWTYTVVERFQTPWRSYDVIVPVRRTSELGLTASAPLLLWWEFSFYLVFKSSQSYSCGNVFMYQFCFVRSCHYFTHEPMA